MDLQLPQEERQLVRGFFEQWLQYYADRKARWRSLMKKRLILRRLKLNKLFLAWKKESRVLKLERFK